MKYDKKKSEIKKKTNIQIIFNESLNFMIKKVFVRLDKRMFLDRILVEIVSYAIFQCNLNVKKKKGNSFCNTILSCFSLSFLASKLKRLRKNVNLTISKHKSQNRVRIFHDIVKFNF